MTDVEKNNKNIELKANFQELYMKCDSIIEKIKLIPKDNDNVNIYKRIINTLSDLKVYVEFYLDKVFSSKSFLENDTMFNKYLAILNGVKNIMKTIDSNIEEEKDDQN